MCVCSLSPVPLFCDHMVCSLPGSTVHELFQARILAATATAKSLQSCPTLCDPIDGSPPGSSVSGILQTRTLEWCCHFLLQCMKVKSESEVAQSCPTQRPHGLQPTRLLRPWDFPGKGTGVGCHCLLCSWLHQFPYQRGKCDGNLWAILLQTGHES